ncbi:hypothetical protein ACWDY4_14685 [Streptomyces olivaceoviridis]
MTPVPPPDLPGRVRVRLRRVGLAGRVEAEVVRGVVAALGRAEPVPGSEPVAYTAV